MLRTIVVVTGLFLCACGSQPNQSEVKTVMVMDGAATSILSGDEDFVYLKKCTLDSAHLEDKCIALAPPLMVATPFYLSRLQNQLGGPELRAFAGINAENLVKSNIDSVEKALVETNEPIQADALKARLTHLRQISWKLVQARDLLNQVIRSEVIPMVKDGHIHLDTLLSPFSDALLWQDHKTGLVWQGLGKNMNWFDASAVARELDLWKDEGQVYERGCSHILGDGWRLPSPQEVRGSVRNGIRLSNMYRRHELGSVWTSEVNSSASGLTYAKAFDFKKDWVFEQHRWNTYNVVCVKLL